MALACSNVAAASFADTTGGDPVTIPSHTNTSGNLYTWAVLSRTTPTVASLTLPGTGTVVILGDRPRTSVLVLTYGYMLCTADGTGTGEIDFSGATTGVGFVLDEWTGIDLADPVIDANFIEADASDASSPTDISITLPNALQKSTNAIWGASGYNTNTAVTEGTDYTQTFDAGFATPASRIFAQFDVSPPDLVWDCSQAAASQYAAIAFEINEASAASTENPFPYVAGGYFPTEG